MKSILISIQPKWCELIASGKKTIEMRNTRPKLKTPFKCYIYETTNTTGVWGFTILGRYRLGKVIGEFVCDKISRYGDDDDDGNYGSPYFIKPEELKQTCLAFCELEKYGRNDIIYGWHISDLVIYDKPRELSEFRKPCGSKITRPPQSWRSWCYVEE